MPIDPSVYAQQRPVPFNDPFAQLADIREQQQRRQLNQQAIQSNQALEAKRRQDIEHQSREEAREDAVRALFAGPETPKAEAIIRTAGPERGAVIINGLSALKKGLQGDYTSTQKVVRDVLLGMNALPEDVRAVQYPKVRGALVERGVIGQSDAPEAYDPAWFAQTVNFGKEPPKDPTVAETETARHNVATEAQAAANAAKPPVVAAPALGTFGDYITRVASAMGKEPKQLDPATTLKAKKAYDEAGRAPKDATVRYQSKDVLNDDGKPVMANFDAVSGRYIDPATNQSIKNPKPVTSAQERMDSRKFAKSAPVLGAIGELSEKINTGAGLTAKAIGAAEKLAAKANYDDDVAEYQALVSGFTPLVARSLGHTGVLTQQDVDSVKELFPKPGDSKTLRDRKVKRLMGIVSELEGTEGVSATPKADAVEEWVRVNGKLVKKGAR